MPNWVKCLLKINKTSIKFSSGGVGCWSINVFKLKICSDVRCPGKKPIWERWSILCLFEKFNNLVFKIEQKTLRRQLLMHYLCNLKSHFCFQIYARQWLFRPLLHDVGNIPDCRIRLKSFSSGYFINLELVLIITVSIKHGLRTADHWLRTGYKTRTRCKMRTTDWV